MIKLAINDICKKRKMTKASYAYLLGVTPTALSRWISGKSLPRNKTYKKIMEDWECVYTHTQ